jgi:hypothetical protein
VGSSLGVAVGTSLGAAVGSSLGSAVGASLGAGVTVSIGASLGGISLSAAADSFGRIKLVTNRTTIIFKLLRIPFFMSIFSLTKAS